ncbi:unnamed protein product, partial [Iphiclides podalirius]
MDPKDDSEVPVAAPEGERSALSSSSSQGSASSSSGDEEGIASPPPNKRSKCSRSKQVVTCSDPRMDTLIHQNSVTYNGPSGNTWDYTDDVWQFDASCSESF